MTLTHRHFNDLDQQILEDKQHLIQEILSNASSDDDVRRRLSESLSHHHGLCVQLKNASGKLIYQSKSTIFDIQIQRKMNQMNDRNANLFTPVCQETPFIFFQILPKYELATSLDVAVATDTSLQKQFLSSLRNSVAIYGFVSAVLCTFLGWLASYHGLAPLKVMRKYATTVKGSQTDGRISVESFPVEMSELASELNRMLDRLHEDFRRLSVFSADLAHELRTPINTLLTQTQVVLSSKRDAATYCDLLATNAEELQRLGRMVSDMLYVAKTERLEHLPNEECFDAANEVNVLFGFYEAVAEENGITLIVRGDSSVRGDRLMFRRAVSNLLSNAIRYATTKSAVTVSISKYLNHIEVNVENMGKVIPSEILPRLFDRFYRADSAKFHPESNGAGLGLSITKAIMVAHGGAVSVCSENGVTRFSLEFKRQ